MIPCVIFLCFVSLFPKKQDTLRELLFGSERVKKKKKEEGKIRKRLGEEDLDTLLWTRNEILGQSSFTLI